MAPSTEVELLEIPTYSLLLRVASDVKSTAPEIRSSVSPHTKWTAALSTACQSLESEDKDILIFPPRTKEQREALKKLALSEQCANIFPESPLRSGGLPIKTPFPMNLTPPRATPEVKERLRQLARENVPFLNRQPYVVRIIPSIAESTLPIASGTLRISPIDEEEGDISHECTIVRDDMLWDSGAHGCIVTSDVLPQTFVDYLSDKKHDAYRNSAGTSVRVEGYLALTNATFFFSTLFTVVPAPAVPNSRPGVILGQNAFLDHMVWTAKPRALLECHGDEMNGNEWGEIHISEWLDASGELHQF
jgi:hypothetical protein